MNFFGLPTNYRKVLHQDIFALLYNSNGSFTHSDVYTMPVYLRRFYLNELVEYKTEEKSQIDKQNKKVQSMTSKMPKFNT